MLNQREISQRKIKIKPIERPKKELTKDAIEGQTAFVQTKLDLASEEIAQIEMKKQQLLDETRQMIEAEKENWKNERQHWVDEAKSEGYQDGHDQGKKESIAAYQDSIVQANKIVDLVKVDYQETLE